MKGPPELPEVVKPADGVTVRVPGVAVKLAVTLFEPLIVTEAGLTEPVRSPDQVEKLYPVAGAAETWTLLPLLYQFIPEGVTEPPPEEPTEAVREYWVVRLAV